MHAIFLLLLLSGGIGQDAAQLSRANEPSAPAAALTPAAAAALHSDIDGLISAPGWRDDAWSVLVMSLEHGDTLFSQSPDLALAPASNVKLFTTAAALYYLGGGFRFNTFLLADGPIRDGVLHGDLVVYGTGDPTIADRFGSKNVVWQAFADTLLAAGIHEVRGAVVGDASYFNGPGTGVGWQTSYIDAAYAAPASALSFAENIATLEIRPAAETGWRPVVKLIPGGEGIGIVNQATTVARGATRIRAFRTDYGGPLTIRGQIARNAEPVLRWVPVSDPARYAAAAFREALEKKGVVVTGGVRSAVRAQDSPITGRTVFAPAFDERAPVRVLAIHNSPPLLDIIEVINKKSHNLLAEQVLRAVGRVATGDGSVKGGVKAIRHMLTHGAGLEEVTPDQLMLFDGSGLSAQNRVTARSLISLLAFVERSTMWESFWSTLPEAGGRRDGLGRMGRTPAAGNLRAKTGTIKHVSALSGYVTSADGERLAFSIISNNVPSTWRSKRVEDAIGARLASFKRGSAVGTPPQRTVIDVPAPPAAPSSAGDGEEYTIRRGDTLDGIARHYGTTVAALEELNPGVEPRRLIPGRRIRIR